MSGRTDRGQRGATIVAVLVVAVVLVLLFGYIISRSIERDDKFIADCESRGGVPVINRGGRICYAKGVVIK